MIIDFIRGLNMFLDYKGKDVTYARHASVEIRQFVK